MERLLKPLNLYSIVGVGLCAVLWWVLANFPDVIMPGSAPVWLLPWIPTP